MRWERISVVWQPTIVLDFIRHMSAPNSFPRTCTLEALQQRWVLWLLTWRSFVGFIYCNGTICFHEALSDDLLNWAAMVCGAQVNNSPEKAAHHGRRLAPRSPIVANHSYSSSEDIVTASFTVCND